MNKENKINFIIKLFTGNIQGLTSVKIISEHEDEVFCLLIGNTNIGVLIKKSFIEHKTEKEIESHFKDILLYNTIIDKKDGVIPLGDNIVIWPDDKHCRDLNKREIS